MKKAYILSYVDGTVQIGNTVFQPCTGASFRVSSYPRQYKKIVLVSQKSLLGAMEALQKGVRHVAVD